MYLPGSSGSENQIDLHKEQNLGKKVLLAPLNAIYHHKTSKASLLMWMCTVKSITALPRNTF